MDTHKTVALTGTTGAMGGEVLLSLMQKTDVNVRCVIYEQEKIPSFVRKTLKKYRGRIFSFRGDIARREDCEKLLSGADYLINCASVIPPKSDHDPVRTYLSNYIGTKNLADAVIADGNRISFIHIATVAMYGYRPYPHMWGRVGDPVISSDYDSYSAYKLKAERYLLECGLRRFVSLRQTAILHKYMFANNLKDGLMFHTVWNSPLEWVTDADSGLLCANLIAYDIKGGLENFWNRIYNIGGGAECRNTGFESIDDAFRLLKRGAKDFFRPNYNITRNFHGVWFYDSDELDNILHFRTQTMRDYWKIMSRRYFYFRLGYILPPPIVSALFIKRLFKNTNAPEYWLSHGKEGRIEAFFGGREQYEKIAKRWEDFPLLSEGRTESGDVDYAALKDIQNARPVLLDHGYDEEKGLENLDYADLDGAAVFRGGRCLSGDYKAGNVYGKVRWKCRCGHEFISSPYTVLKGGYWCPECCEPPPWRYGALADIPFYAQVYFDSHSEDERDKTYPRFEGEDDFLTKTDR